MKDIGGNFKINQTIKTIYAIPLWIVEYILNSKFTVLNSKPTVLMGYDTKNQLIKLPFKNEEKNSKH